MILSKPEIRLLQMLCSVHGPMPVAWLKPHFRGVQKRLRELGLLYKRDPEFVQLTKLGRATAQTSGMGS